MEFWLLGSSGDLLIGIRGGSLSPVLIYNQWVRLENDNEAILLNLMSITSVVKLTSNHNPNAAISRICNNSCKNAKQFLSSKLVFFISTF